MELLGNTRRPIPVGSCLAPSQPGTVVAADAREMCEIVLHPDPGHRNARSRCFEDDRRRAFASAMQVQLVVADLDQPPRIWELPPLERGRDALIGNAGENDEREQTGDGER